MPLPLESPDRLREPHLLKFRLRQMFFVVTLLSGLCASIAVTHGPWPWVIGLSALLVGAHISGNLIGTRLRDTSCDVVRWRAADPRGAPDYPFTTPTEALATAPLPPETNLRNFGRMVVGMRWYMLGGLAAGSLFAGTVIGFTLGRRAGWGGWLVGAGTGGVFGIWAVFMGVHFATIARDAWQQANRE
jgi:hypothetical protein